MLLPKIKTHDGVLKNAIKTFLVFFYTTAVLPRCEVIIWTKFYKNANISSTTNGKLTKSVSNFRKFNNPYNELSLKWIKSTCRTPWSVLIASGRFFEENYLRVVHLQIKNFEALDLRNIFSYFLELWRIISPLEIRWNNYVSTNHMLGKRLPLNYLNLCLV